MRLNVGCGKIPMKGWTNLDREWAAGVDIVGEAFPLPMADGSVEEVWCGHFLEHLSIDDTPKFLAEVKRVLKPGGKFSCVVPDFRKVCMDYMREESALQRAAYVHIWGFRDVDAMRGGFKSTPHQRAYDMDTLFDELTTAGFIGVCPVDPLTHPYMYMHGGVQSGFSGYKPQ